MAKLGEVCKVSPSTKNIERQGAWLLNLDMVEQQTGRVVEYNFVGEDGLNGSITQFDTENVLYSKLRPNLNKVVLPERNGFCTSELLPLRPDARKLDRSYLAVFLRSDGFVNWAVSKTAGAKMPRLGTKDLLNANIPLPEIKEQKAIAEKFKKLEQLISLRKQQLAKLDELAKARFVEMFGDISNNRKVSMQDVCKIITDGTHQPPKFVLSGIPFLFVSNIVTNEIHYDAEKFISEETYNELIKRTPIEVGDVLLSTVGSYGHPAVVKENKPFCFQRHIAYLKPNNSVVNSEYLRCAILSTDLQRQIDESVKGIAQKTLNLSEIRKLRLPLPSLSLQNQFAAFVERIDQQKQTVQQSLEKLELMKKALMQEYFG